MISVELVLNVTKEDIEDVIDTAGYGIAYWAKTAVVTEDAYKVLDADEKWFVLTHEDIKRGIAEHIKYNGYHFLEIDDCKLVLDTAQIDADDADAIIQYACFGTIVYC